MSKDKGPHLLTMISGDKVQLGNQQKVIKKELFSELLTGKALIEKIYEEGETYKVTVASESEEIKEKAEIQGFQKGYEKWLEKVAELEEEIQKVRQDVEQTIIPVALKAAKKIVGKELEIYPETVTEIVRSHLKAVAQHKRVTIWVAPDDFLVLDKKKNDLKLLFEELEAFTLRPREDLTKGGCVIETESGIINATFENQWAIIERAFAKLKNEKASLAAE